MASKDLNEAKREIWVDDVKVVACMLVLLGHLMQSMVKADIVQADEIYHWFNKSIYYFHVPLFFICSGYLYQKLSLVNSFSSWGKNCLKKLINLGIPYIVFTVLTWFIKALFPGSGNNEIDNVFDTLFLHPVAPYWFLYTLFFCFLITGTFKNVKTALIAISVAILMKVIAITGIMETFNDTGGIPYVISSVLSNEIWFVIGMNISVFGLKFKTSHKLTIGIILCSIFLVLSVCLRNTNNMLIAFILGLIACCGVVLICMAKDTQGNIMKFLSKYTMPIFLMHSIFAALFRSILLRAGVTSAPIHISFGIAVSIFGPVLTAWIMNKTKYLDFLLYPGKFIKIR